MEALVLVGGFAAVFVFGYFLMSKLDDWLAEPRSREDRPRTEPQLRIAASQLDSVPAISAALKELGRQRPGLRCALILGEEQRSPALLPAARLTLPLCPTTPPYRPYSTGTSHCIRRLSSFQMARWRSALWGKAPCASGSYGTTARSALIRWN